MLYPTTRPPKTPPWARRNLRSSPASPPKPGRPPTPGATPRTLPPRAPPDCPPALPPPLCRLGRRQQGCILPCPPEPLLLSLLLLPDLLALLPEPRIHPPGPSRRGSILPPTCPSRSFRGHTVVRPSRQPPLLLLDHGDPCPPAGGGLQWGASIPLLVCHIHPQGHIPLLPRLQGPRLPCRGALSLRDRGGLRHQLRFHHPPDPIQFPDCTQHRPILTKCHLHPPEPHPCPVDLTLTADPEAG